MRRELGVFIQTRAGESALHLALRLNCIDIARTILESPSFDILLSDSRQPSKVLNSLSALLSAPCDYFAPGRGAKYCDEYACLFVCLSVCPHNWKTARSSFTNFFAHVIFGHGSVLL